MLKKTIKFISFFLLGSALLWISYFFVYGNFHRVDNDVYRSAQLFSFNMPYYVKEYKIKSIINLRGPSTKQWYADEVRIAKEYNITHYDFGIGNREILSVSDMKKIVLLMKNAPKPLFIHCKAGVDRTVIGWAQKLLPWMRALIYFNKII